MSDSAGDKLVLVGEIAAPFGVRGEIKMRPMMEAPKTLAKLPSVLFRWSDQREEALKIESVRIHQGMALLRIAGVEDRDAVERFRQAKLYIKTSELPKLPPGEYYEHQLLGLKVITDTGRDFGVIEDIHYSPANDVYETAVAMIPAVEEAFILSVDLEAGQMTVRDVPGLEK
ncbi:MAG: ribosome maturation factor RimM [Armatimonadaceae bacterium]